VSDLITARLLVPGGPCSNCAGVGSLPATAYSVGGPDRYPCGVCGGLKVRLVEAPDAVAVELDLGALVAAAPEACDGGLPSALPACGRAPTCTACLRCRDHCRCTAGADARGSR
jgi:hypothetical protein